MEWYILARSPKTNSAWASLIIAAVLYVVLYLCTGLGLYVIWLVAWSLTAFMFYGVDKMQAKGGGSRIPEVVLHGITLVGGFPGAWLGMLLFWHKVRKPAFWAVLVLATVLHLYVIGRWGLLSGAFALPFP